MARTPRTLSVAVPIDTIGANASLFRIGALDRKIASLEAKLSEEVARLRAATDEKLASLHTERSDRATALRIFAEQNRTRLLRDDKKSVELTAGRIGWRMTPARVELTRGGEQKALAELKKKRLRRYIRVKESLDREALLRDRPTLSGVRYTQREEFFLEPAPDLDPEAGENVIVLSSMAA